MLYIGIDPGLKGAIAVLDGKHTFVDDLATTPEGMLELLQKMYMRTEKEKVKVALEDVYGYPGMSVKAVTTFMKAAGWASMLAHGITKDVTEVRPQTWKKYFGLDKDKNKSVELAKEKFPQLADKLLKSKDGRAEALLIALWLSETSCKDKENS